MEQIVVTAQRRSERLSKVGVTVTAIGAQQLAQRGVASPRDLVRLVPGFQATQSFNGNPVYTLRGVGFDSTNTFATSPIGLYINQDTLPYPAMTQGLVYDLARVEVLKGPQGTLYGRNATGGLINYVTQQPTPDLHAGITTEFGNYGTIDSTAFVSGRVADGIDMRVTGNTQNRLDGWQESVTHGDHLGEFNQNAFRAITNFDRGGPLTANLEVDYWKKDGDAQAPQAIYYIPGNSPFGLAASRASIITNPTTDTEADWLHASNQPQSNIGIFHPPPKVDTDYVGAVLRLDYAVNDLLKLESTTSFNHLNDRNAADLAGLQTEDLFQDVNTLINSFNQEIRAIGHYENLNWTVGGYYANDTSTDRELGYNTQNAVVNQLRYLSSLVPQTTYTASQIANGFGNYLDKSSSDTNVKAVFVNADYRFNQYFKIDGGARYTQDDEATTACTYDYQGGNVPIVNLAYPLLFGHPFNLKPGQCYTLQSTINEFVTSPVHEFQGQSNVSWRGELDFTPNDRTLVYASISRGFKAGGFPLLAASRASQFAPVAQEQLTSYEFGTKLALFDRTLQFNVSGFYYDYVNKQVLGRVADIIFGTLVRIENIPKSDVYGLEWDIAWRPVQSLTLAFSGVFEKSNIQSYMNYDEFSNFLNFAGKPLAYTPDLQLNTSVNYSTPINDKLVFNFTGAMAYQDDTNGSFADLPLFDVRAHTIFDGTIGVGDTAGRWRVDLYGKNLLDKYYWTGVTSTPDSVFRYAGLPRQYGVRLTYNF